MQCDICFRVGGQRLPFLCPTDARNQLYDHRIRNAKVLLEKDALDQEINAVISQSRDAELEHQDEEKMSITSVGITDVLLEKTQAFEKTAQIIQHAEELRAKLAKARKDIAKRSAGLAKRKSELKSAYSGLAARRGRQTEDIAKSIRMTRYKWNQVHAVTVSSRAFLCGEAAKLYGLRRIRKSDGLNEYRIGGIGIVDLRALNTASPAQISTSLSHIVHLLMLATHYLGIRMPAEITLPHRDYPLPTVISLTASHTHSNVPFPGTTPSQSSSNSPTDARHPNPSSQPRPRPLSVNKPLPMLANEDPATYALFMEGVTLLAYNIAWVCKSQGVSIGDSNSFEDICVIGKNLYNLLIGSQAPSSNVHSPRVPPMKAGEAQTEDSNRLSSQPSVMGHYSHGTAHSSLASAEGNEYVRSWKLLSPIKLADRLKSKLMSEVANSEWEVLDQDSWAVDDDMAGDGVVVGARKEKGKSAGGLGMQSFMSMRTVMDAVEMVDGNGSAGNTAREKKPGTSGWTKLKSR